MTAAGQEGGLVLRRYGGRWTIRRNETLHVWTAERHEGTVIRFIVAHTATELAGKLETAGTVEP